MENDNYKQLPVNITTKRHLRGKLLFGCGFQNLVQNTTEPDTCLSRPKERFPFQGYTYKKSVHDKPGRSLFRLSILKYPSISTDPGDLWLTFSPFLKSQMKTCSQAGTATQRPFSPRSVTKTILPFWLPIRPKTALATQRRYCLVSPMLEGLKPQVRQLHRKMKKTQFFGHIGSTRLANTTRLSCR